MNPPPPEVISTSAKIAANSEGKSTSERHHNLYVDSLTRRHVITNHGAQHRRRCGHVPGIEGGS